MAMCGQLVVCVRRLGMDGSELPYRLLSWSTTGRRSDPVSPPSVRHVAVGGRAGGRAPEHALPELGP